MGFKEALAALLGRAPAYGTQSYMGPLVSEVFNYSAGDLYRTQPHVRTVVSFLARSVAQLNLQVYERVSDTDRRRVTEDPFVALLARPNPDQTQYEFFESIVSEICIYDNVYLFMGASNQTPTGWLLRVIPSTWLHSVKKLNAFSIQEYVFTIDNELVHIPAENIVHFHGWSPGSPSSGSSPIDALKQVVAEQIQAWNFREQMWARGGRVGSYLTRPTESPLWSAEARDRFKLMWNEFSGQGAKAGSTPILEDGMELKRVGFSAKDDQWLEASKLSLATVASVYQVNPVMVGILDNANFSNTEAFRKMLYSDTLGPLLRMIEDRFNSFILPRVSTVGNSYAEFNIQAKLAGDFEEQASILSTSIGAPFMTRNEGRARMNLPALDGGDDLITPLNVLVGGQASPQDGGTGEASAVPPAKAGVLFKAKGDAPTVSASTVEALAVEVTKFFERQGRSVLSKIGGAKGQSKAANPSWWDQDRWDKELSGLLANIGLEISAAAAAQYLTAAGLDPSSYDPARTVEFLTEGSLARASSINLSTRDRLLASLEEESEMTPSGVYEYSSGTRAAEIAGVLATGYFAFGAVESGRQQSGKATKTWIQNASSKPRSEHSALNGETVGVDDVFSNGARWPGDDPAGAAGNAYCNCSVEINYAT